MEGPDQIYFGTDPASHAFGAKRFATGDGPFIVDADKLKDLDVQHSIDFDAHSHYFTPGKDKVSARNIALVVAGQGDAITTQDPR